MHVIQKKSFFCYKFPVRKSAAILFRSLQEKRRKRLSSAEFDIFASHSDLVHDVTDTDLWAHNDSIHGRVFATFKRRFQFNKADEKCKTFVSIFVVRLRLIRPVVLFWISK